MGWLPERPVLAADYCVCESTKIVGIKRRVDEMEKQSSQNSQRKRLMSLVFVLTVISELVTVVPLNGALLQQHTS